MKLCKMESEFVELELFIEEKCLQLMLKDRGTDGGHTSVFYQFKDIRQIHQLRDALVLYVESLVEAIHKERYLENQERNKDIPQRPCKCGSNKVEMTCLGGPWQNCYCWDCGRKWLGYNAEREVKW